MHSNRALGTVKGCEEFQQDHGASMAGKPPGMQKGYIRDFSTNVRNFILSVHFLHEMKMKEFEIFVAD